ncbi:MAG: Rid family detoxifying hydrolase [Flavobacteriaceae bacterium]
MKKIIRTAQAPAPIGPYNQAIKVNNTLYVSGQIGLNPVSMQWVNESIEAETKQVLQNLAAILEAAQMDFSQVVKTTIFLDNMDHFQDVNAVYGTFFDEATAPARETVAVKTLPKSVRVEISLIAVDA